MRLIDADKFKEHCIHKLNFFPAMISRALEKQPTIEVVPKEVYEQVKLERNIAIDQLKSYGIGLGEKAEMQRVQHGKWIYHCNEDDDADIKYEIWGYHECSNCHFGTVGTTSYCPKCGAKMDGEK